MLKFKYLFSAFCMLVAMTMATSAFAQNIMSGEQRGRTPGPGARIHRTGRRRHVAGGKPQLPPTKPMTATRER